MLQVLLFQFVFFFFNEDGATATRNWFTFFGFLHVNINSPNCEVISVPAEKCRKLEDELLITESYQEMGQAFGYLKSNSIQILSATIKVKILTISPIFSVFIEIKMLFLKKHPLSKQNEIFAQFFQFFQFCTVVLLLFYCCIPN